MGMERLASRPVVAVAAGCAAALPHMQLSCAARTDRDYVDRRDLLGVAPLHRGARRALTHTLVGGAVLLDTDAQVRCELVGIHIIESPVAALNVSQRTGGNFDSCSQLGLGESFKDAPVTRVALIRGDRDDLLDRGVEDAHDAGQQVDLRCTPACFPVEDRDRRDVGKSGEVADADAVTSAHLREARGIEAAQHTTRHTRSTAWRVITRQGHRELLDFFNGCVFSLRHSLRYGAFRATPLRRIP